MSLFLLVRYLGLNKLEELLKEEHIINQSIEFTAEMIEEDSIEEK